MECARRPRDPAAADEALNNQVSNNSAALNSKKQALSTPVLPSPDIDARQDKQGKAFFFEKKKQKGFVGAVADI